jgi:PmbA protein
MHTLIETANNKVDQAELYWQRQHVVSVRYENYRLQQITENDLSSVALRAIVDGKMGSTFGVSPDQHALLDEARRAAAYGDQATFSFAPSAVYPRVANNDQAAAALRSDDLVALCESVKERVLRLRPDVALFVVASSTATRLVIETTQGAKAENESTAVSLRFGAPIREAGTGVYKSASSVSPLTPPDELIAEFDEWYGWTESASTPSTGRLPTIFAPEAAHLYLLPLWAGLDGDAIDKGTSPLLHRIGEAVLSEKLTIVDDPLRTEDPRARPFDDEGVPCQRRVLVDKGVLQGYLLDQRTAGNAAKRELFSGGTETSPNPWPMNITVEPGECSYRDMIADLDEGLLITAGLGFHSGNYPQGQFSVQAVGFHIRGGKVVGRLEKTMVSGDIYEDLRAVTAVSREHKLLSSFLLSGGPVPYVCVDSLQVAGA